MRPPVPIISVIIPVYNHAPWVTEAVRSVLAQSFQHWELLLIDDASNDDSWTVLQGLVHELQDSRVRVWQHSHNQGAAATLNEGMQQAQGHYFAILNSDDTWHPERLAYLYELAEREDWDFMSTPVELCNAEPHWQTWYQDLQTHYQSQHDFLGTLWRGNFVISTSNFFFRRRVYEQCGGFSEWRYVHDYEYLLRLSKAGLQLCCRWDAPVVYYRFHASNTIREQPYRALHENMQLLFDYLPQLQEQLTLSHLRGAQQHLSNLLSYYHAEWQTELHQHLVAKEAELFPLIADRDAWIRERDRVITQQQQHVKALAQNLAGLQNINEQQQQWVQDRDGWIAERDPHISTLQSLVEQQKNWIQDRDGWIAERDQHMTTLQALTEQQQTWLNDRDNWIAERDQLIQQLQIERDALKRSRAYRLGQALLKPLRFGRDRLWRKKWRAHHA